MYTTLHFFISYTAYNVISFVTGVLKSYSSPSFSSDQYINVYCSLVGLLTVFSNVSLYNTFLVSYTFSPSLYVTVYSLFSPFAYIVLSSLISYSSSSLYEFSKSYHFPFLYPYFSSIVGNDTIQLLSCTSPLYVSFITQLSLSFDVLSIVSSFSYVTVYVFLLDDV